MLIPCMTQLQGQFYIQQHDLDLILYFLYSKLFIRNALEEMILWTKQGKLWQFPVDNEQGKNRTSDP